ncbi:hypothetical protein GTZ88_01545 [Streptococcus pyogenes]|nr:hypothetical protein [Streptococcus pyogenes]
MLVIVYLGQNKRDNHQIVAFLAQSFLILLKKSERFLFFKGKASL